ncbi:hypothetical protein HPB51_015293 [Rhipicephalus microplus]|uniref:Peptidase S1 domain-containing protein n=1 Tax=Rhipicephalus microplus TaxID=6941 RepID=A0A9J6DV85_RHIMP|nr:hypothetical protein HPB51_015293 [Rhipicephalus microplus]
MKANAKSATAAWYKKEWIYDCSLLKIKSTAVYTFLQENEFLPLPNQRTLYGYLRNLKADFGFDSTLFTVLREKLEAVPEREHRGVLMFDEMSVRKSVHIRELNMALLGKVDFAEHTRPWDHGKDGDHVLVFLFRLFLGGWSQTLFGESTVSAMEFYSEQENCKKLHGSAVTSEFTRTLHKLFDCLNSRRPDHVRFNEAQHIAVRILLCFLSKQTCGALKIILHSSVALIESLLSSGFHYALVGNFGQDPLERFFGIVRHVAGDGSQPTVQHFLFIYRMLSVNNLVRPPKRSSVEEERPQLLLKLQGLFGKEKSASSQVDMLAVLFDDVLEEPGDTTNISSVPDVTISTKECILDYLAGYVVKKSSTMSCTDCVATLKSQTREPTDLILKSQEDSFKCPHPSSSACCVLWKDMLSNSLWTQLHVPMCMRTLLTMFGSTAALLLLVWAVGCTMQITFPTDFFVVVGEEDITRRESTDDVIQVLKVTKHPQWDRNTLNYDYALLELSTPLDFEGRHKHLMPICLPEKDQDFEGQNCTISGLGLTRDRTEGGRVPAELQKADVPVLKHSTCREFYAGFNRVQEDTMICAGLEEGGRSVCQGDSGGPLQCPRADGRYVLAGLTSWGIKCAAPRMPGVFARVATRLDWIRSVVGETP